MPPKRSYQGCELEPKIVESPLCWRRASTLCKAPEKIHLRVEGIRDLLAPFFYDYNFEMMRLAMAICASRPPGSKRASSCTLTSPLRNMKRLNRGPDIA